MMFSVPCETYEIDPIAEKALDLIFILHVDHEQNASTSTVRLAGSSGANPFACIASGIAALWGPAHGGANEAVLNMLIEISDAGKPKGGAGRLPQWVFEIFGKWTTTFFNCGCREYPECEHGKIRLGRWLVDKRKEGFNPSGLAQKLHDDFELWAYPGDIFSWLDSLIHSLRAVQRIANVAGKTDLSVKIDDQIARIERPLEKDDSKNES